MKTIFDPVIKRILDLIKNQLDDARETCSAMFLVGGFSESIYLQNRIKKEFRHKVKNISVPPQPMAAIARGATVYGLECVINSRVLRYTYGVRASFEWVDIFLFYGIIYLIINNSNIFYII